MSCVGEQGTRGHGGLSEGRSPGHIREREGFLEEETAELILKVTRKRRNRCVGLQVNTRRWLVMSGAENWGPIRPER